jgi:DNA-binding MarR family transcriptional regulator
MVPAEEGRPAPIEFDECNHPDLRSSDIEVLRSLGQEEALAFQGLKRKMHIHQEKLSRALQRLEQIGLVTKTERGYALTAKGIEISQRWPVEEAKGHESILQSFIPGGVHPRLIANQLEGRWFGNLRWLGTREGSEETVLRWVTYDTEVEVDLRIRWGEIIVDTDAHDRDGMIDAFLAAQLIYAQLRGPWSDSWSPSQAPITT